MLGYLNGRGWRFPANAVDQYFAPAAQGVPVERPGSPAEVLRSSVESVDRYCAFQLNRANATNPAIHTFRPLHFVGGTVYPAGQVAWAPATDQSAALATDANNYQVQLNSAGQPIPGTVTDANGNTPPNGDAAWSGAPTSIYSSALGGNLPLSFYGTGSTGGMTPGATAGIGMSPASQQALYNTVGGALKTTGATIAAIINSGNQMQIAQLQAQTQQQIAALNAQAARAQSAGNLQLAQQQQAQASQLQQFYQSLALRQAPATTALWIAGGVAAVAVLGAIVYFATRPAAPATAPASASRSSRTRANPTRSRRGGRAASWDYRLNNPLDATHSHALAVGSLRSGK
jgi:hypothetical protein